MALELFKPFIIAKLIERGTVHNIRSANRYIDAKHDDVWDILEEVVKDAYVLLNRAPTLHRLGIQAFKPVLIEGLAVQIHPLVCAAFNADFDGDQMAVHVPLSSEANNEAAERMLASKNLLKPANGQPIVTPNQDIVWGCYYLTTMDEGKPARFCSSVNEAIMARDQGLINLQSPIKLFYNKKKDRRAKKQLIETSLGRIYFNEVLPEEFDFINKRCGKKDLSKILAEILHRFGPDETVKVLDNLKNTGFKYLTLSAQSLGMADLVDVEGRADLVNQGNKETDIIDGQYMMGLLTEDERHEKIVENWLKINNQVLSKIKTSMSEGNPILAMIDSGARGSWGQLSQMIGMKGPVVNPNYEVIELPVKSNFKNGFNVLEFFISSHGARKGLSDTALRTSSAGYLTRRLVDVAQEIVVTIDDCGDTEGITVTKEESEIMGDKLVNRISGRWLAKDLLVKGKVVAKAGELVTEETLHKIGDHELESATYRSVITCKNTRGICAKCYGYDLAYNKPVELGTAVGVMAAQSVGEPGTQLTMRTFHTGGVASEGDITQGLPRVEEIFETRAPKNRAVVAEVPGIVKIREPRVREIVASDGESVVKTSGKERVLEITYEKSLDKKITIPKGKKVSVLIKDGDEITVGQLLFTNGDNSVTAPIAGTAKVTGQTLMIFGRELGVREYLVPSVKSIMVKDGQKIEAGDQLTEGALDLHQIYSLKGQKFTQQYIMKEIQHIYSSQGQKLNDKHVEVIIRQMFSKVYVLDAGDSDFMPGEVIEYMDAVFANQALAKQKKKPVQYEQLLLGITKVSLSTRSWLAAASFQETAKVLINAAITGRTDDLSGLKENIIIGRKIPAGTGFTLGQWNR